MGKRADTDRLFTRLSDGDYLKHSELHQLHTLLTEALSLGRRLGSRGDMLTYWAGSRLGLVESMLYHRDFIFSNTKS